MLSLKAIPLLLSLSATSLAQSLTDQLAANPNLSNLTTILSTSPGLAQQLSGAKNITILAPSNEAFTALMNSTGRAAADNSTIEALLSYHVLQGTYGSNSFTNTPQFLPTMLKDPRFANFTNNGMQVVEAVLVDGDATLFSGLKMNSSVSQADINFDGGVIHVIDSVLTLPMNVSTTALAANLTALAGALIEADLVNTVDTAQSLTIFAPTNAAFQAIGNLLPDLDNDALTDILTYHVVAGTVGYSTGLTDGQKLETLQGGELTITINNGTVFVNGARVTLADVITSNGVVHIIDNVLNPNNTADEPETADPTQSAAFSGATSASDVPFTSSVPTMTGDRTVPSSTATATETGTGAASSLRGNIAAGAVMGAAIVFALAIVA